MQRSSSSLTASFRLGFLAVCLATTNSWGQVPVYDQPGTFGRPYYQQTVALKAPGPAIGPQASSPLLHFDGRHAWLIQLVPPEIYYAVLAANRLQGKPYKWGGGHQSFLDTGYDCSGSTSHVLMSAGLLDRPITSSAFMKYGRPGPGRYITIYARSGHVFMEICGLRLDAGGSPSRDQRGPLWRTTSRDTDGWAVRHPPGF